jgi:hypothetical protein
MALEITSVPEDQVNRMSIIIAWKNSGTSCDISYDDKCPLTSQRYLKQDVQMHKRFSHKRLKMRNGPSCTIAHSKVPLILRYMWQSFEKER